MPRKKNVSKPKAAAVVATPKKSSKLLSCFLIIIILILLGLGYSMVRFFLPNITLPIVSFLGQMGVSEFPKVPGIPFLKSPADYRISQADDYQISMEVTIPYFNLASRGNFNIVSQGLPVSLAAPGDPDWKTEWKVYQDVVYDADLEGGVKMEAKHGAKHILVDIPGKGIKAKSSGQSVLTFSLAGVSEGETFPIKIETSNNNSQMQSATQGTRFIDKDPETGINIDMRGSVDYNSADTYQDQTFPATGKLIEDNGEAGALINVGSMELPAAYKDAALQARDLARQYNAPGGLQNLYDDSGRINNASGLASMDTPAEKPLRIFLASEENK